MIRGWVIKLTKQYDDLADIWKETPLGRSLTQDEWNEINRYLNVTYGPTAKDSFGHTGVTWHINHLNNYRDGAGIWYFCPLPMYMMKEYDEQC